MTYDEILSHQGLFWLIPCFSTTVSSLMMVLFWETILIVYLIL